MLNAWPRAEPLASNYPPGVLPAAIREFAAREVVPQGPLHFEDVVALSVLREMYRAKALPREKPITKRRVRWSAIVAIHLHLAQSPEILIESGFMDYADFTESPRRWRVVRRIALRLRAWQRVVFDRADPRSWQRDESGEVDVREDPPERLKRFWSLWCAVQEEERPGLSDDVTRDLVRIESRRTRVAQKALSMFADHPHYWLYMNESGQVQVSSAGLLKVARLRAAEDVVGEVPQEDVPDRVGSEPEPSEVAGQIEALAALEAQLATRATKKPRGAARKAVRPLMRDIADGRVSFADIARTVERDESTVREAYEAELSDLKRALGSKTN
jgi:hypothetical protein